MLRNGFMFKEYVNWRLLIPSNNSVKYIERKNAVSWPYLERFKDLHILKNIRSPQNRSLKGILMSVYWRTTDSFNIYHQHILLVKQR